MSKIQFSKKGKSGSHWITIPSEIMTLKGWKTRTILKFREISGEVCLVEVR